MPDSLAGEFPKPWTEEIVEAADVVITMGCGDDDALRLIRRLPPDMAEAVSLRIAADLTVADVAEIMGKRAGTVRVLVHRGLERLGSMIPPRMEVAEIPVTRGSSRSLYRVR
jgi:DNA-directed RNA polymerase specialized sigma24 family protein